LWIAAKVPTGADAQKKLTLGASSFCVLVLHLEESPSNACDSRRPTHASTGWMSVDDALRFLS
jgi:hypothetical protein